VTILYVPDSGTYSGTPQCSLHAVLGGVRHLLEVQANNFYLQAFYLQESGRDCLTYARFRDLYVPCSGTPQCSLHAVLGGVRQLLEVQANDLNLKAEARI